MGTNLKLQAQLWVAVLYVSVSGEFWLSLTCMCLTADQATVQLGFGEPLNRVEMLDVSQ